MNNADKFKQIFDLYATELWAMSEKDFLAWLNTESDVPGTNVGDLISRQAAIKAIDDLPNCYNGYSDTYDKAYIIGTLEEVPSVDVPDRKVGKWINDRGLYKCSVCDNLWTAWWAVICHEERMYKEMKYCPNCGAKMSGDIKDGE